MEPKVSMIMGGTSNFPVMEGAAKILNNLKIPFEVNALSAHRMPEKVEQITRSAYDRGFRVIIAGAGNVSILAAQILSTGNGELFERMVKFKENLKTKIVEANNELQNVKYEFKV
jgi:5-(carboxyamino)imidazole ribonucleotide mutase